MCSSIFANILQILTLATVISAAFSANLICNGDFQGRNLPFTYLGENYNFFSSNYSCWFNKNGGDIKLKHKLYPPVTTTAQLSIFQQYVLCQNVQMEVGKQYELNFSLANSASMSYARILAKINDVEIMNLTSLNQYSVAHGNKIITANATTNKLCFQPNYVLDDITYNFLGPCIDNVSIVEIVPLNPFASTSNNSSINSSTNITSSTTTTSSNQTLPRAPVPSNSTSSKAGTVPEKLFEVFCRTNPNQDLFFIMSCTYQNDEFGYFINQIKTITQVFVDGELQKSVEFADITLSSVKIVIQPNRQYLVKKISIAIPDELAALSFGMGYKFRFYIDDEILDLLVLNHEETRIIRSMYPITEAVMQSVQQAYLVLRASFFSYFLLDIISFWNLSLMYNFLNISTVPLFSRYFLQKLQKTLFKLNNIISWIAQIFPQLKSTLDFSNTRGREHMEEYKNSFAWFGAFGASTKYLNNNIEQIFVIGILVLKIGLITLLGKIKFMPALIKKQLPDGLKKFKIFLNELIGIQIFMVISASKAIQNLGMEQSQEKVNSFLQVSTLFLCITVLPLNLITQGSIWQKKVEKKLQGKFQTIRSIPTLSKIQTRLTVRMSNKILASIYHMLQFLPFVFIPFLITFNNPQLFLAFNTVILTCRFWFLCRYLRVFQFRLSEKVFGVLNLSIWVVHHCMYLVFWMLDRAKVDIGSKNEGMVSECIKVCGFATIFTVLLGGGFQLLKFCIQILSFILKQTRKMIKKCNKPKLSKISPQQQAPQEYPQQKLQSNTSQPKKTNININTNPNKKKVQKKVKLMVEVVNDASILEGNCNFNKFVSSKVEMNRSQHQAKYIVSQNTLQVHRSKNCHKPKQPTSKTLQFLQKEAQISQASDRTTKKPIQKIQK